jgi:hypothetical protein
LLFSRTWNILLINALCGDCVTVLFKCCYSVVTVLSPRSYFGSMHTPSRVCA